MASVVVEFVAEARADLWAFDTMRRGPQLQTLRATILDYDATTRKPRSPMPNNSINKVPSRSGLEIDLCRSVSFFSEDQDALSMPFMHSFPKNCCERCAALLCVALRQKYPDAHVVYVKGRNAQSTDMHFWIEVDQFVLDPTASQFNEFSDPLLCQLPHPLEPVFIREHETRYPEYETDLPANSNGNWHDVLRKLIARIEV